MKTPISPHNPFGHTRHGFAWEQVQPGNRHLDYGCFEGKTLRAFRDKGVTELIGVDASGDAIEAGRGKHPDLDMRHIDPAKPLPFGDGDFDSVSLLDVLEHVQDQRQLLDELNRVLAPGGRLIVTVPRLHIFSVLDVGNLKFRFPRLHRWFFCMRHSREAYEYRYVNNPDGLIGDISAEKAWHEHFSPAKLQRLLEASGFQVELFDGSGLFTRVIFLARNTIGLIPPIGSALDAITRIDNRWFKSMNLFCVARKESEPPRR